MAFINDYLTNKEIEKFKEYQIKYAPKCTNNHKVLGTEKRRGGIWCTVDRERKVYLFYCGDNYRERLDGLGASQYFAMVINITDPNVFYISLERQIGVMDKDGYNILWDLIGVETKSNVKEFDALTLELLKEALGVYGLDGDPQKMQRIVKFNF